MRRPLGSVCLLFILFLLLFYICFPPKLPDYTALRGKEVYVNGRITSIKTQEINEELQFVYTLEHITLQESIAETGTAVYRHRQIYCYTTQAYPDAYLGSQVWVKGSFSPFEATQNPGQFDSRFYYHILGAGANLMESRLVFSDGAKDFFRETLHQIHSYFIQKTDAFFHTPYAGIMKTILLGDRSNLDSGIKQLYKEGGILHIMTISGMHISMLGMGSFRMLQKVGVSRKKAAVMGLLVVILYGTMIGMQAATFRAVCMFVLQMSAILWGRTYDRLMGLAVAAVLLLLEQPMYVFYSGFLLSFGAVLGIIVVPPIIEKACNEKGKVAAWFGRQFSASIGILLITLPVQLYFFYEYSLYSMLINAFVLPVLPYVAGFGAVVLFTPYKAAIVSKTLVPVCEGLLWFYEWVCTKSCRLPYHCLVLGAPKGWQIAIYYVCLGLLLALLYAEQNNIWKKRMLQKPGHVAVTPGKIKRCKCIGMLLFSAAFVLLFLRPTRGLTCQFLSVGQGDCALIRYNGQTYLTDCGSSSKKNVAEDIVLPCLKYYGISEVNGVFLSHYDEDHINGIIQWLEKYEHSHVQIGRICLPALEKEALEETFGPLLALAEKYQIPICTLGAGDRLSLGKLQIQILHPEKGKQDVEDSNSCSQVMYLEYEGQGILMTGDIGEAEETKLLKSLSDKKVTVLKVAHHGSKYSSSQAFLETVKPVLSVISYGRSNLYGHPHKDTLKRLDMAGSRVLKTAEQGAVSVNIYKNTCYIALYNNGDIVDKSHRK